MSSPPPRPRHTVVAPLVVAAALITASGAAATVMVRASVEALTAQSEIVALGTVVDAVATDGGPHGEAGIFTRVELVVAQTWRGPHEDARVLWVHGGRLGDRAMRTHGQATFAVGERVVVFLDEADGALFPTGMSQGKWRVEGDRVRSAADPGSLYVRRGRALRPAAPLPTMPLSALRDRVRSVP